MAKTAYLNARIDPELKAQAEDVFSKIGLSSSQAITLFYKQVEMQQGLPFEIKIPNKATLKAIEDAKTRRNLKSFNDVESLFDDLE